MSLENLAFERLVSPLSLPISLSPYLSLSPILTTHTHALSHIHTLTQCISLTLYSFLSLDLHFLIKECSLTVYPSVSSALSLSLSLSHVPSIHSRFHTLSNKGPTLGGSTGLVVMGGDSCSEGRGFESWHHILDGHFSHIFGVKIGMMFF